MKIKGIDINDEKSTVHIGFDGIYIEDKDKTVDVNKTNIKKYMKENKSSVIKESSIYSGTFILTTIIYILLGFYVPGGWEMGWILYLVAITLTSLLPTIKERRLSNFTFPLLIVSIYVFLGMYLGVWHPTWVLFLLIPVYYIIIAPIDKKYAIEKMPEEEFIKTKDK